MKKNKRIAIIISIINVLLLVGIGVGQYYATKYSQIISIYFGHDTTKVQKNKDKESKDYFTSSYKNEDERKEANEALSKEIVDEGIVLLKNDEQTLPLTDIKKISILGQSSVDLVAGGGGSGSVDTSKAPTLLEAFEKNNIEVNPTLWKFYQSGSGKSYRRTTPDAYGQGDFAINEVPKKVYTEEIERSFNAYNDAAVVVIGRSGGESSDLSTKDLGDGTHYLEINNDEKDLLQMAVDHFEKVIVVVNASNTLQLGFLEEYPIDACISVGALGKMGALSIVDVLTGKENPSGGLVDTYAYDVLGAPAIVNFGDFDIANSETMFGNKYMVYAEGIYTGYRYYETRYEDVVLGNEKSGNYDYTTQVQYPFGYGLSYTDFEWTNYKVKEVDDAYEISLDVKNTGDVAGKDTVQIYLQNPYTDYDRENQIEKTSVELVGFAKTKKLNPNESETVQIVVEKEVMKTYDANKSKTYLLEAGDYYLSAGTNAHTALNNILNAKGYTVKDRMDEEGSKDFVHKVSISKQDTSVYSKSLVTNVSITNQFEDADLKTYDKDFNYLSRSNWSGTWPTVYKDGKWTVSEDFLKRLEIIHTEDEAATMPKTGAVNEQTGKLEAASFIGIDYDDENWEILLDQLTVDEMTTLVRMGGYATTSIPSINLPATLNRDGPAGISNELVGGASGESGTAFPAQITLAATWNVELAEKMGEAVGEDSLALGISGWYAPGINLHRNAFGGRNFEYYSEDSYLSGVLATNTIKGVQSRGTFVFMKHFALNDSETNRMGGLIFANEQTLREQYLYPFEIATRQGNATGVMASMNRVGTTWSGAHKGLMTETLRNEWGFEGMVVTDQASFSVFAYEDVIQGIEGGTDLWLNTDTSLWKLNDNQLTPTVVNNLRRATKNIIYTVVNSNAMNGISAGDKIVKITPLWKYWVYSLYAVVISWVVGSSFFVTKKYLKERQKEEQ